MDYKQLKTLLYPATALLLLWSASCRQQSAQQEIPTDTVAAVTAPVRYEAPEWSKNLNIYEVNLRQFSASGSIKDFETHLPRIKALGTDLLWFMPLQKIGEKNRKGPLGSYYSIQDYRSVNPEHGTAEDFKAMVQKAHEMGMYVILDWVPNHTAWDHPWTQSNPEFYMKDSLGNFTPPVADWEDVIHLDYSNPQMRKAMIEEMKFWLTDMGIDGFRCDVAHMIPVDFWAECRHELEKVKRVFMLAEAEGPQYHANGFDMTYGWHLHHLMNKIASGDTTVAVLDSYYEQEAKDYGKEAYRMQFTTNHDENSWQGTEFERMGKDGAKAFYVFAATVPGMPLIYTGQEIGLNRRLKFFEKDAITWKDHPELTPFYTKLLALKKANPALWNGIHGGDMTRLHTSADQAVYAYTRNKENDKVMVVLNLTKKAQKVSLTTPGAAGRYLDLFKGDSVNVTDAQTFQLKPWEYKVYVK